MRRIERDGLRAPARVVEVDATGIDALGEARVDVARFESVFCLTRANGVPTALSFWAVPDDESVDLREIAKATGLDGVEGHLGANHVPVGPQLGVTVAICTRDRPTDLRRALASLQNQSDPDIHILVVDNAPSTDGTALVVEELAMANAAYVVEPRPGLSRARNTALDHVETDVVAWIDDDEVADADWIRRLRQGFAQDCAPAAVSGLMLPAELESEAQVRFEQYGGFNKGRGTEPEVLRAGTTTVRNAMYPLPGFGAGGNMAFRMQALRGIGGFDQYLGAGTRTHGGEETRAFACLLRSGEAVLHWPSAVTWHFHRRTMDELRGQLFGYSAGLSAFYASMFRSDPRVLADMVKVVPQGFSDLLPKKDNMRSGHLPDDFPRDLLRAARKGFAEGAFLYVQEVLGDRKTSR